MEKTFDFVVVGAGSAGCVLAERLSADGRYTVAVIEAGGSDRRFHVQMPLGYGRTFYDRAINWNYAAEPDPGLDGRADFWPRGKLLGGSSSINAMVWIRGAPRDFDGWAAEGNPGWAYADVLPFFKALEHNQAGEDPWRGTGGRLHVSDVSAGLHPLVQRFIAAGRQAGFAFNADFNGPQSGGRRPLPDHDKGRLAHVGRQGLPTPGAAATQYRAIDEGACNPCPPRGSMRNRR